VIFAVADRLHRTVDEIGAMPLSEFFGWLAYFQIMKEDSDGHRKQPRPVPRHR